MAASSQDRIPELRVRTGTVSKRLAVAGVMLGTVIAIVAMSDGARLRLGGMPEIMGVFFGALLLWLLIVAASLLLIGQIRRHHKTVARYAARQGARGISAVWRSLHRKALALLDIADAWAGTQWRTRTPTTRGAPVSPSANSAEANQPEGENMTTPQSERGHVVGWRPVKGSRIAPDRRAQHTAARTGALVPAAWNSVVGAAADFDPESDAHFLDWMSGEIAGMAAYAEALIEVYEGMRQDKGADPNSLTALHDVADGVAHAAETMAGAKKKFADHYDQPREFAANGGVMTHDGRWITGEGE